MTNSSYWKQRLAEEEAWQAKQIEADTNFDKLIEQRYRNVINDIEDLIDREVNRLSEKTGTNYSQMMKQVTTGDIERYEKEAKELVKQAEGMRKSGKKVSYKDFTDEENLRMKIYNATMRINRLEYLKSMTGAYLTHVTMDISDDLRKRLTNEVIAEQKRQAGLLGKFLPDYDFKASYSTQSIVMQSMAGANWSQRLWRSQDTLKASLDRVLTTGFVTGEHPRVLARKLKDQVASTVKNSTYVTERLARTESARVQYDVQYKGIKDNGFKQAWYFAERRACKICQAFADKKTPGEEDGVYDLKDVPRIPMDTHPNCRCSISSYIGEAALDEFIQQQGINNNAKVGASVRHWFDDDQVKEIQKLIEKAPTPVREMWNKYTMRSRIDGIDSDSSYYNPATNSVTFNIDSVLATGKQDWRTKYSTFFHEFGHFIDHNTCENPALNQISAARNAITTIRQDYDDLLAPYLKEIGNMSLEEQKKACKDVGEYFPKTSKRTGKLQPKYQKFVADYRLSKDLIKDIKGNLDDPKRYYEAISGFSDVLQGISNSQIRLGIGHSPSYYRGYSGKVKLCTEWFANMLAAKMTGDRSLAVFEKYMPNSCKLFDDLVKEINEHEVGFIK